VALEDSQVCVIPYHQLEELSREVSDLQRQFHRIMSREIVRDHGVMLLLGSMRAEERLAAFLLNLTQRLQSRGFSASELILRMTREEIGSYLGLKLETVSRTFSKFQDERLLEVKQRQIRILDQDGLQRLVNGAKLLRALSSASVEVLGAEERSVSVAATCDHAPEHEEGQRRP
jgi:CRP/FNR family transcriptional regulator